MAEAELRRDEEHHLPGQSLLAEGAFAVGDAGRARRGAAIAGQDRAVVLPLRLGQSEEHQGLHPERDLGVPHAPADPDLGPAPVARPDPGLYEIGQGAWEGLHHDEIATRYGEELAGWRRRPTEVWAPSGESLAEVQARVRPALATLLGRLAADREPGTHDRSQVAGYRGTALADDRPWTIAVGHDGLFKVLLLTLFDLPLERFWSFSTALCGITVVELRAGRPVLVAHNLTEHLAPLREDEARAEAEAAARSRSGAL